MNFDFTKIDYLIGGSVKQKLAYTTLTSYGIIDGLQQYDPILVGTIPINIDIESSDLDIICCFKERVDFIGHVYSLFGGYEGYSMQDVFEQDLVAVIARFRIDNFDVEIFGQSIPTKQQNAYRHMIIEHQILCERGEAFRQKIIDLKLQGYKTEPAFGFLLGLQGNPYIELLDYGR